MDQPKRLDGSTALMLAAKGGHAECVQLLIAAGAGLDHGMNSGLTSLMLAVQGGHTGCQRLLLEAGAAADLPTMDGKAKARNRRMRQRPGNVKRSDATAELRHNLSRLPRKLSSDAISEIGALPHTAPTAQSTHHAARAEAAASPRGRLCALPRAPSHTERAAVARSRPSLRLARRRDRG